MSSDWGRLAGFFALWKCLLLFIAVASPGPGYDTSTQILFRRYQDAARSWPSVVAQTLATKLTRWDAIYFASSSERGYLFEQEWAFSRTYAILTSTIARAFPTSLGASAIVRHALAGVLLSNLSHFLSAFVLYRLTYELLPLGQSIRHRIAFTASCLHVITPGGLFLAAPNAESTFALANFTGMLCYILARKHTCGGESRGTNAALWMLVSGFSFGFASMIRGNGLLSGMIFAWDAIVTLPKVPSIFRRRSWNLLVSLMGTLVGGAVLGVAYATPQAIAYREYCLQGVTRPWCYRQMPSIYTWVQDHYWGVGLFRYWTLSNLPLFLLAAPMLFIQVATAITALRETQVVNAVHNTLDRSTSLDRTSGSIELFTHTISRLALPQLVLAFLTTTTFHVQIINRISSGYPVWYIVLAVAIHTRSFSTTTKEPQSYGRIPLLLCRNAQLLVKASVVYAIVQGGLYACFMPPA